MSIEKSKQSGCYQREYWCDKSCSSRRRSKRWRKGRGRNRGGINGKALCAQRWAAGNGLKIHFIQVWDSECDSWCKVICDTVTFKGPPSTLCVISLIYALCYWHFLLGNDDRCTHEPQISSIEHYCPYQKSSHTLQDRWWMMVAEMVFLSKMISKCFFSLAKMFSVVAVSAHWHTMI